MALNLNKWVRAKNRLWNGNLCEIHLCVDGKVKTKAETANYSTAMLAVSMAGETDSRALESEKGCRLRGALHWLFSGTCGEPWARGKQSSGKGSMWLFANDTIVYLENPGKCGQVIRAEERIWQHSWCSDQRSQRIELSLKKKKINGVPMHHQGANKKHNREKKILLTLATPIAHCREIDVVREAVGFFFF